MKQQNSILPSQCRDFMTQAYWEKFFKKIKKEGAQSEYFEWYGEYSDYEHLFKLYIKPDSEVLHVGCGKSLLSEQLYDNNICKKLVNVDFEKKSLDHMAARSKNSRPEMKFQCFSLLDENTPLQNEFYDIILDKGTLDAIYPPKLSERDVVFTFFKNMENTLKNGGYYILISLLQEHIIKDVLDYFVTVKQWNVVINESIIEKSKLYPFFVVIQKQNQKEEQKNQNEKLVLLQLLDGRKLGLNVKDTVEQIKKIQLQNHFITQVHKLRQGQQFTLDLWSKLVKNIPRYTLFIYDNDNPQLLQSKTCGCFIIPQGKENSYLFNTPQGHRELQKQAQMSRLVVARMNAGHQFESLKEVQNELSPAIDQLIPRGCKNLPCPFMTDGDEIADKMILFQTEGFIIEEIVGDGERVFRRLIQKSNLDLIQSQVKLDYFDEKNNAVKFETVNHLFNSLLKSKPGQFVGIDQHYLDFQAHNAIVAGFAFLTAKLQNKERNLEVLVLGGGTGSLGQFLCNHYSNIKITNVELSEDVIMIADNFFEFRQNQRQSMICADALDYVKQVQDSHQFDCIIIDINSSDINTVSPPPQFLSKDFFSDLQSLLSEDDLSVIMLNLVDRHQQIKQLPWNLYYSIKCEDEVNEIMFFPNNKQNIQNFEEKPNIEGEYLDLINSLLQDGRKNLEKFRSLDWDPTLSILDYVTDIKMKYPKISNQKFTINECNIIRDGEKQEAGDRKEFYQQDLEKVQKKKNQRKKVNKRR